MRMPIVSAPVRRRGFRRDRSVAWKQFSGVVISQEVTELTTDEGETAQEDGEFDLEEGLELPLDITEDEQALLGATEG